MPDIDHAAEERAEALARRFHETYERLAPSFGYKTREASAVPWEQIPDANRDLMTAVAGEVLEWQAAQQPETHVTDEMVAEALDARASMSQLHCYLYSTEKCRCGEEWSDAHWMRFVLERAMSRAAMEGENPAIDGR